MRRLWFDVGIEEYTTGWVMTPKRIRLWFDVGIEEYTTHDNSRLNVTRLWFDVGIEEYTTHRQSHEASCVAPHVGAWIETIGHFFAQIEAIKP